MSMSAIRITRKRTREFDQYETFRSSLLPVQREVLECRDLRLHIASFMTDRDKSVLPFLCKAWNRLCAGMELWNIYHLPRSCFGSFTCKRYSVYDKFSRSTFPLSTTELDIYLNESVTIRRTQLPIQLQKLKISAAIAGYTILSVQSLPNSLIHLMVCTPFTRAIEPGVLPESLQTCSLQRYPYDHVIKPGVFPNGLISLSIYVGMNIVFEADSIPKGLKYLSLRGSTFKRLFIPCVLPQGLESLLLKGFHPDALTRIRLPTSVRNLSILPYLECANLDVGMIPEGVTCLKWTSLGTILPGALPSSLTALTLLYFPTNGLNANTFPAGLKKLYVPLRLVPIDLEFPVPKGCEILDNRNIYFDEMIP